MTNSLYSKKNVIFSTNLDKCSKKTKIILFGTKGLHMICIGFVLKIGCEKVRLIVYNIVSYLIRDAVINNNAAFICLYIQNRSF